MTRLITGFISYNCKILEARETMERLKLELAQIDEKNERMDRIDSLLESEA